MADQRTGVFARLAVIGGLAAVILGLTPLLKLDAQVNLMLGMAFPIIDVLLMLGLIALYGRVRESVDRQGQFGYQMAMIGLVLLLIGSIANYWLLAVLGTFSDFIAGFGSLLGVLSYTMGCLVLAFDATRERWNVTSGGRKRGMPALIAIALWLGGVVGVIANFTFVPYIPDGFIFGIGLSWVIIGAALLVSQSQSSPEPNAPPGSGWWG